MNVWRAGEQVMSYQNVLVAVKIVFQNISVADLSLVLSYKLLHSISPLPPRQIDPLWSTPTLSWLFRNSLLFVAATYLCSFFERLFNVYSNTKQFHWISNWHDRNSQSHIDKTSDRHSDNTRRIEIVPCENIAKRKFIWLVATRFYQYGRIRMLRNTL